MRFYPREGTLRCSSCAGSFGIQEPGIDLPPGVLMALRHAIYADFKKLFSFSLAAESQPLLARASQEYTLSVLERGSRTLDFFWDVYMPDKPIKTETV